MSKNRSSISELVARLKETRSDAWQYLEVKQLAEILARHREKVRLAIREYRLLKQTTTAENDAIEKLYLGYEGMFLRDHLRDALRLYVMINRDYHDAMRSYMAEMSKPAEISVPVPSELLPGKKNSSHARKAA